ncbi:Uncharacterised protein [uncultured archaeon]|nr:Uncharacterised protein [uncultured archaeon]
MEHDGGIAIAIKNQRAKEEQRGAIVEKEAATKHAAADDGGRAELEAAILEKAERMIAYSHRYAALHETRIAAYDPSSMKAFTGAMDEKSRGHFEALRQELAPLAAAQTPDDYEKAREELAVLFEEHHEWMETAQALSDRISEDFVLRHIRRDVEQRKGSEPETLSGLTGIGYQIVYGANIEMLRERADKEKRPVLDVIDDAIGANKGLIEEIKDALVRGPEFERLNALPESTLECKPLKRV